VPAVLTPDPFTTVTLPDAQPAPAAPEMTRQYFRQRQINPPAHLWVTPDDFLVAGVVNALTGVQLQVQARLLLPDGQISLPGFTINPAADRVLRYFNTQLYYGYLVSVCVWAIGATLPTGTNTFCSLQLVRPPIAGFNLDWPMASGYVTANTFLATPYGAQSAAVTSNGQIYTVVGAAPAAGADWTITVPASARWRLRSVTATLTCTAAAGNRNPGFQVNDGTNYFLFVPPPVTSGPNAIQRYNWAPGVANNPAGGNAITPIPDNFILGPGYKFGVGTGALQGGDQWTAPVYEVEEWLNS
jgi:hypothetical protein